MIDKFRDMSDAGKIAVIAIMLAIFIVGIILIGKIVADDANKPVENTSNAPYPTQQITPTTAPERPTTTPSPTTTATSEATETATATPAPETASPEPGTGITYGETELSVEDQQSAQNIAKEGLTEYYNVKKGDTAQARNERLTKYFDPASKVLDEESIESNYGVDIANPENYLISVGTIDYIDPVGGSEKEYKVIAGVTSKIQFNREDQSPQILEKNDTQTVVLSKSSGAWKIISING